MKIVMNLVKRNVKLFFRDKGMFLSSMITPIILIVLFVTFLGNVYRDSINSVLGDFKLDEKLIEGFVGGWLFSSLLAVSCVTVAFCSNLIMIQDKYLGVIADFTISPIKKSKLAISYFISSAIVTLIICYTALIIAFIYLGIVGFYLSFIDIILIILDVLLLALFGTALSSIINYFLSTQGQLSAVSALISSCYGFICGAYMPMSQFSNGLRNVLSILPSSYGTTLLHSHFMDGPFEEMRNQGIPDEVIDEITTVFDGKLQIYDNTIDNSVCMIMLIATVVILIGIFVLMNVLSKKKIKK